MTRVRTLLNAGVGTLLGIGLTIGLAVSSPTLAAADPDAVKDAQKRVQALEEDASKIDLEYAKLTEQLDEANAKVKTLDTDIAKQRTKVDGLKTSMGQLALVQYQNSGLNLTAKLIASPDDDSLLNQLSTVQSFTARTNGKLQVLQAEQATLTQYETTLQTTQTQISAARGKQGELSKQQKVKLDDAEQVLGKLTVEEKARLEQVKREEAARQLALAEQNDAQAANSTTTTTQSPTTQPPTSQAPTTQKPVAQKPPTAKVDPVPAASGGAARAVAYARAQAGKGYVMGTSGPSTFDCSGLTSAAWRQAGVNLPRTSQGQASAGVRVSVTQIQAGDLVIFYSGATHVGIYVGNGMIVDAANPRSGVRLISLHTSWMPIHSVRRVG